MSSEQQSSASEFPGQAFIDAREALGLSLEQLSRELRLSVKVLRKIESGEFDDLGGPVFVRGYIRAYARRLKLDPAEYVSAFDRMQGIVDVTAPIRTVGSVSTSPARQSRSVMRIGTLVFFAAIIAVVVWWWKTQYSIEGLLPPKDNAPVTVDTADGNTLVLPPINEPADQASDAGASVSDAVVSDAGVAMDQADAASEAAAPLAVEGDKAASGASVQAVAPTAAKAEDGTAQAAPAEPNVDSSKSLHISLSDDSWISVKDADGKSVYSGIAKAGQDLDVGGKAPLSIVIGRASAVRVIEYAGNPVDLADVSSKNVARLTLP